MKRLRLFPLLLLLALAACDDVVGPDSSCTRAKMQMRLAEGSPNRTSGPHQSEREVTEYWYYDEEVVIFRWGGTRDGCEVSRDSLSNHYRALGIDGA